MEVKTCFFIGHREAPDGLLPILAKIVEQHITKYDVSDFYVGQYGAFDRLAARAVIDAKKRHPKVTLTILLSYYPADRLLKLPDGANGSLYPLCMEEVPKRVAIPRANRWMVDHSTHLIAYVWHPASNARKLLDYARTREKRGLICIENIAETIC